MGTYNKRMELCEVSERAREEKSKACDGLPWASTPSEGCVAGFEEAVRAMDDYQRRLDECRGADPLEAYCKENPDCDDCKPFSSILDPLREVIMAIPDVEEREKVVADIRMTARLVRAKQATRRARYRGTFNRQMNAIDLVIEKIDGVRSACFGEGASSRLRNPCAAAWDAYYSAMEARQTLLREIEESSHGDPMYSYCKENPVVYECDVTSYLD